MNDPNESRERRRAAKQRLAMLRAELREARVRQRAALLDAKERCRAERLATRERHRALRIRAAQELRDERAHVRAACLERRANARRIGDDVGRVRAQVIAERANHAEMRRLAKAERVRRGDKGSREYVAQTDDEIAGTLPSDLAPLFERVKGSLKGRRGDDRRSAFLVYAESHPNEVLAANENAAAARVQELEAEIARAKVEARAPNAYEARKAARIERMRTRAERLGRAATGARAAADAIAGHIPMGQPILVGHYSERRHRRDLDKIHHGRSRAIELQREATDLDRRADFAEANRTISSDDPEALSKLLEKLAAIDSSRARMVDANKAVRSISPREGLANLGFTPKQAEQLLTPDFVGRLGFPDYALRNAAAEAARIRKRIDELLARATKPALAAVERDGVRVFEADNRVRVVFDAKPGDAVRAQLKAAGFRWAPSSGAWQRHASNAAWHEAKRIVEGLPAAALVAPTPAPVAPAIRGEGLDTTQIAKRIREDIAAAVRAGVLPGASYSVRTDKYSMGSSITVGISKLPFSILNPDAFLVEPGASWMMFDRARYRSRFTDEAQEVERKVNAIVDAYHWDKSDSMTDYYNERFARDVRLEAKKGEYEAIETEKLRAAREPKGEA